MRHLTKQGDCVPYSAVTRLLGQFPLALRRCLDARDEKEEAVAAEMGYPNVKKLSDVLNGWRRPSLGFLLRLPYRIQQALYDAAAAYFGRVTYPINDSHTAVRHALGTLERASLRNESIEELGERKTVEGGV